VAAKFAGSPLLMLGQPCNQFGGQEPGDNSEIKNCVEYVRPGNGYKIPANMALTQKGDVNGILETPLFKSLKASCGGADVGWNFELWTVSKEGKPNKRYTTGAAFPDSTKLEADITALLAA
jgi:glutathione peroxidase